MFNQEALALTIIIISSTALAATSASTKEANKAVPQEERVFESYPKDIANLLTPHYAALKRAKILGDVKTRGVYSAPHLWSTVTSNNGALSLKKINVCFLDGSSGLHQKVRDIALQWTKVGGNVPLFFGKDPKNPQRCKDLNGIRKHIRISFNTKRGVWAAVGWLGMRIPQTKASMNISKHLTREPKKFERAVLHEFGHALGLEHEHVHKFLRCWDDEYNKKKLLAFLKKREMWDRDEAKKQLRAINLKGVILKHTVKPDPDSIMHYSFAPKFYKNGTKSVCFAREKNQLSNGDKKLIAQIYKPKIKDQMNRQIKRGKHLKDIIKSHSKTRALDKDLDDALRLIEQFSITP